MIFQKNRSTDAAAVAALIWLAFVVPEEVLPLEDDGVYLVIERDSDKIQAPVAPFYVWLPMPVTEEDPDTGAVTIVGYSDIATVYPKNVPVTPPDSPPDIPPPDDDEEIVEYAKTAREERKALQDALRKNPDAKLKITRQGFSEIQSPRGIALFPFVCRSARLYYSGACGIHHRHREVPEGHHRAEAP